MKDIIKIVNFNRDEATVYFGYLGDIERNVIDGDLVVEFRLEQSFYRSPNAGLFFRHLENLG